MMSEQEFDRRLREIEEQYQGDRVKADAARDQAMARLFEESCWTQERIAQRVGKKQAWVSKRLIFGRFLHSNPTGLKLENLTEWHFREHWQRTAGKEEERFAQVARRLAEGIPHGKAAILNPPGIRQAVAAVMEQGGWYTVRQLTDQVEAKLPGVTKQQVRSSLSQLRRYLPKGKVLEARDLGGLRMSQYRIRKVHVDRPGRPPGLLLDLWDEVKPILAELEELGNMHECRMAPSAVRAIAQRFRTAFRAALKGVTA